MPLVNDSESKQNFMTKPLPQILDEIGDSIRLANEAAKNARNAALEAREAGEKAAREATKTSNERIARVEQMMEQLKSAITDGMAAVDKGLSEKAPDKESAAKSE